MTTRFEPPLERSVTIRFSHIDGASIVFYPRYFELLSELFTELPFDKPPFAMQTDFLKPNFLADEIRIAFDEDERSRSTPHAEEKPAWSFTGRMNGAEHFSIRSLPGAELLDKTAHHPDRPAFQSDAMFLAPWTTDCSGNLQVSRYYELLNAAVEQWFPRTLGMSFHELHTVRSCGIPTVVMRTRCRLMPAAGDEVNVWIRPTGIGNRSATYTCWLVRDGECLLENEQTIVFVKRNRQEFHAIPIPDGVRERLRDQYVAP